MADEDATRNRRDNKVKFRQYKTEGTYQDTPLYLVPHITLTLGEKVDKTQRCERVLKYLEEKGAVTFNEKRNSTLQPTLIVGAGAVPDMDELLRRGLFDLRHHAAAKGTREENKWKRQNLLTYELNRVSKKMLQKRNP